MTTKDEKKNYKVLLSSGAIKDLDKIPRKFYEKVYKTVQTLSSNPRPTGCLKLTKSIGYRIKKGNNSISHKT